MQAHYFRLPIVTIFIVLPLLTACSPQASSPRYPAGIKNPQTATTAEYVQSMAEIHARSTQEYLSEDPEVLGYRAVLLLEHTTDLILLYSEKIQAQELQLSDPDNGTIYLEPFSKAVSYFSQTTPTKNMVESWNMVSKAIQQFSQAYNVLERGEPLSLTDINRLKTSRQLLTNYQTYAEENLARRGLGNDFVTYQQQWAENYLNKN